MQLLRKFMLSLRLTYSPLGLLRPFVAYQPDPEAMAVNAFSISWKRYVFFMLFLLLVFSQKCYRKSNQRRPQNCWLCLAGRLQPWPLVMRLLV